VKQFSRIALLVVAFSWTGIASQLWAEILTATERDMLPPDVRNKLLLSLSSEDYPVTPGDTYRLTYLTADRLISLDVVAESDFSVNLGFFGKIPGRGKTFLELKRHVEQRVLQVYPQAVPSLTIVSNGLFRVQLEGEVSEAGQASAWGLSRLSQVVEGRLTPYSSIREIRLVSPGGAERRCDLFLAQRFGQREQDPYVGPGDTIVLSKRERSVALAGQVRRPGNYQLLSHEGLRELIEYYGDGFTIPADRSRVRVERLFTDGKTIAESFVVDLSGSLPPEVELRDLDAVVVPVKTQRLPVVFLEGAILPEPGSPGQAAMAKKEDSGEERVELGYSKLPIQFREGATLYQILLERKDRIYPNADLARCYLVRKNPSEVLPLDLERLLFAYSHRDDVTLREYDELSMPFRNFTVSVTGAVWNPGVYPYVPNKTFEYYLELAGGVDPERGRSGSARVFDHAGLKLPSSAVLDPEGRVHVPYSFTYYFLKYAPIVVTATGALLTGLYYIDQINE